MIFLFVLDIILYYIIIILYYHKFALHLAFFASSQAFARVLVDFPLPRTLSAADIDSSIVPIEADIGEKFNIKERARNWVCKEFRKFSRPTVACPRV